jgi:hypothetical protein
VRGQLRPDVLQGGPGHRGEYLFAARNAETAAGGPTSPAGQAAFQASLVNRFNTNYASAGSFWAAGPSDPTPASLFSRSSTYGRPGTAYLALREILGSINFTRTLQQTQRDFGGASITEPSSRASPAASCPTRARRAPPGWMRSSGSGSIPPSRPAAESTVRSSPVRELAGPGFYDASGGCIGPPADGAGAAPSASAAIGSGGLDVGDGRVQRGVG